MKSKDNSEGTCKDHIKLIDQLLNQNTQIKQKYQHLLKQHQKLKYKYDRLAQLSPQSVVKQIQGITGIKQLDDLMKIQSSTQLAARSSRLGKVWSQNANQINLQKTGKLSKTNSTDSNDQNKIIKQQLVQAPILHNKTAASFKSSRSSSRSSMNEKFFPLIQGCFIIEKKKCFLQKSKNSLSQMLEYIYPEQLIKTEKQTLQMMLKYTFTNLQINKIQDDQFNSRKNQIIFGTPYDDYTYAFEDGKWIGKRQLPQIMSLMGTMKKKYYHILVKPQIVPKEQFQQKQQKQQKQSQNKIKQQQIQVKMQNQTNQYFYQTQVIFGFISPFPLRFFFQDLHRTMQQQLKYSQLIVNQIQQKQQSLNQNRKQKYKILSKIMQKVYKNQYKINKFPINFTYNTGIASIQLNIPNVASYRQAQDQFLNQALQKYDFAKISKLLHYVLAEKCILIEANDKKTLNQIFQIIRILIRPFLWIFAIVYVYSDYFQPFMSSPMPIIIGKIEQQQQQQLNEKDKKNKQQMKRQASLDYSQFCYIKMDEQQLQLKQNQLFYKPIKKFKKQWQKSQKQKKQTTASFIHNYVNNLRVFIQKGVLNSQPTDFHIQFIETQMVSYFKQTNMN